MLESKLTRISNMGPWDVSLHLSSSPFVFSYLPYFGGLTEVSDTILWLVLEIR